MVKGGKEKETLITILQYDTICRIKNCFIPKGYWADSVIFLDLLRRKESLSHKPNLRRTITFTSEGEKKFSSFCFEAESKVSDVSLKAPLALTVIG